MSTAPSRPSVPSDPRSTRSTVPPAREHGYAKHPGAAEPPGVKPESSTPPCYVDTARGGHTGCERRPVSTAAELQAQISELVKQGTQAAAVASDVSIAASNKHAKDVEGATRPLITIYGLPAAFVPVLLDSPLAIDPAFVEAHAAGRSYRPMGVRRRRGARAARYAHWDYPELVTGYWQAMAQNKSCQGLEQNSVGPGTPRVVADLARQPVVRPVSDAGKGLAAVFCRASLWVSKDVDVLFLDKPRWGETGPLRKACRPVKFAGNSAPMNQENQPGYGGTRRDNVAVAQWNGEEIPSLESVLQDSFATTYKDSGVLEVLQETAYEQWLELFEVLTPRRKVVKPEKTSLEWQIMRALERNFDMAKSTARSQNGNGTEEGFAVGPGDWGALIQRLRTRLEILAATCPGFPHKKPDKTANGALPVYHEEKLSYIPRHRPEADSPSSQGSDSDNQRALDRVTYLGATLLPFSIVSGVLSMNEGFEPGQPLFWVFWVATIPLTLFTVLVIYADKLRQVEVWSEVRDHSGSDSGSDQGSTKSGDGEKVQETEKGRRRPIPEFGIYKYNRPQQPEAVTYSAGGDVVIDLGTPTAETQQLPTAEPPSPYGADQRTDSDEDQEQEGTSSDEDTAEEVSLPISAAGYHPGWKKKQLGWKGAAMCMLKMRKPLRVLDGMPVAAREGQRDD